MELCQEGKQLIEYALTNRGWTLEKLAEESEYSISTVKKFSSRKNVGRVTFVKICRLLEVDWEIASGKNKSSEHNHASFVIQEEDSYSGTQTNNSDNRLSIDNSLIERVKEHCRQKILSQHSRMRLLSTKEIGVEQIYVDVFLLNRPPRTFMCSESELTKKFDLRKDRIGFGDRISSKSGLEVAKNISKLIIVGDPGAGKTTFLKQLAYVWCQKSFQSNLITIII